MAGSASITSHTMVDDNFGFNSLVFFAEAKGGLGVKDLGEVMKAMKGKLAWAYLSSKSIWSTFVRAKYGDPANFSAVNYRIGSLVRRSLLTQISSLLDKSIWVAGSGHIRLWQEKWAMTTLPEPTTSLEISGSQAKKDPALLNLLPAVV
ncbi:unnamed protein product [Dovyalis caffra]|uniref:Uncharacterized protein n=1 Tax=Dovyalis caffra TaxID=77055 RepID=A0AAV1RKH8_9ROSI|nr:unnamed protein product [Dovyalis caffra]